MANSLGSVSLGGTGGPTLQRRRSKNPLRNMMQHLTVEAPREDNDDGSPGRGSLIRRLSWRKSRSPSAHSEASSAPASATIRNVDANLCVPCSSLAADIETTLDEIDECFAKTLDPAADDAFDGKEHFVSRLRGLEENKWAAKCPLCKFFWETHVPGQGEGDYTLSAFSSRDTNYLIDSTKMFDMNHPARLKGKGLAPGFFGVVPKKQGDGAKAWDVDPFWFRESGMIYRTMPQISLSEPLAARGRAQSNEGRARELPALLTDSSWLQKGIWGREIGPTADLSVASNWLQFCERHHQGRCGRRQQSPAPLPGFKLIDCSQWPPKVVPGQITDNYVALSYVAGGDVGESWPKVVQDAITVTRELKFRYLWMDKLCIDPGKVVERRQHIERMDEIFEGAVVTIIAAHGESAMDGLPGVGSTARPKQPSYRFADGNVTLVSSLRDPRLEIQDSTWFTRGWTYQEGLLARRRLIFTEGQMYWECDGLSCPETLLLPLATYYDSDQEKMCDFVRPGLFNGVSYMDGSWEAWKKLPQTLEEPSTLSIFRESDKHITQYTKRNLTLDEDSLNAFEGITRRLEKTVGRGKLGGIVGIPLWCPACTAAPSPSPAADARKRPARTRLLFALTTSFWHHSGSAQPRRRRHLPSWTWAGWQGEVELYSSVVVIEQDGTSREKKILNHHYVSATQLTRNESLSRKWAYSPEIVVLDAADDDGGSGGGSRVVYDFSPGSEPASFPPGRYLLRVSNPFVLDKVKARVHNSGWVFNDVYVDVRLSRGRGTDVSAAAPVPSNGGGGGGGGGGNGPSPIREYLEQHARGERMTVLWFVEEATILLLVLERTKAGTWERVGRARMGFGQDAKDVMRRFGSLEAMINSLPLRRLGEDVLIE
ncbi:hypothetical protein E4U42_007018 [Claviceps africana]|uniref:Rhodanese domain-containing protein n=1 Tax=Claviceps africana TaxID=83212 RepID=A0A8K0NK53_9HYPO|nr:hypothetical protein E4U42_007018 [Claviceps africana]